MILSRKGPWRARRGTPRVCSQHLSSNAHPTLLCPQGTHVLQLEIPHGPLISGLLSQEVNCEVTVVDRDGVCWPVMLT